MQNLSGWIGPSSIDSARSSQDRLTPMYSLESIKSGGAASGLASSSLDSRLGSGMLPGQAAYSQAQQVSSRPGRAVLGSLHGSWPLDSRGRLAFLQGTDSTECHHALEAELAFCAMCYQPS